MADENLKKAIPSPAHHDREANRGASDETDLWLPILGTLREYRKVVSIALASLITVFLIGGLAAYLRAPTQKIANLNFRLEFEGVDKGEYPNGSKFSVSEILATPVLAHVFETNNLKRYMSFEEFKNSVFILDANRGLENLAGEYNAKLADPKVTPVDRERIEKEYQRRRESLGSSEYSLNLTLEEHSISMPSSLSTKILNDILGTWASFADQRKGMLQYRRPVYSRNVVQKEFIEAEDYIVAVDILRSKANRILGNIGSISDLPGATTIRVGKERISLQEIQANLEDILRFKLQPLFGMIRATSLSKDPRFAIYYWESQLSQKKRALEEARGNVKTLEEGLRQYAMAKGSMDASAGRPGNVPSGGSTPMGGGDRSAQTLIPQISESFFDRLVELSNQSNDAKFRQELTQRIVAEGLISVSLEKEVAFYEELLPFVRSLTTRGPSQNGVATQTAATVKAGSEKVLNEILESLDQVTSIYQEISSQNLNPQTFLYTVTAPASSSTENALRWSSIILYGILFFVLSAIVVVLACLIHARFREPWNLSAGRVTAPHRKSEYDETLVGQTLDG
ncbi:MAG: hypothetical protein HY644_01725 [Acidobacteria bacterium]|nr:hypothetical protein [Acidobacteriota bacterium]